MRTRKRGTRKARTRQTYTQKGGFGSPGTFETLFTMTGFGISAFLIGPLYLLTEFLNIPVSSLNLLSRKAFDKNQESFLHLPLYQAIQGCPTKMLPPDKFILQDDMYINQSLAVVSCDRSADNGNKVKENDTHLIDSLLDLLNVIPDKRRLQHYVFQLFDYIENIRATDQQRKEHIHKLIRKVNDYETLTKVYLIYLSLEKKCPDLKNETKTILKDEDTIRMINPFYIPCRVPFNTRIKCAWKHLYKKSFGKDEANCHVPCKTCTFRNSLGRLTRKYMSLFSGGCNASVVRSMMNTYFHYLEIGKDPMPPTRDNLIEYLDKLPLKTVRNDQVDPVVYEKFERFICKYDIVDFLKKELVQKIHKRLDRGYTLDQVLRFIRDDSKPVKA